MEFFGNVGLVQVSSSQPGVPIPLWVREKLTRGTHNFFKPSKEGKFGGIFDLGVRKWDTIVIWGYAEGLKFDLGVNEYQKVENSC